MNLALTLLGELKFSLNGKPIKNLNAVKAYALLIYLVVDSHHAHRRDALAEMFWPNKPEGYGRNNLKQTLSILRAALGDRQSPEPFIISSNRDLQFNTNSDFLVDLLDFEALIRKAQKHCHAAENTCKKCAGLLDQAAALYQDDFLVDFYLSDSPEFNEWVLTRRETCKRMMSEGLDRLISCYQKESDYKNSLLYAKRLVSLEPWSESNHRRLMALLAANGKRSAALKQYHTCKAMLASEFNVIPTQETLSLYEKIKSWKPADVSQDSFLALPIDPPTIKHISAKIQQETSYLKYWVIGSLLISFLMFIWFGYTNWVQIGDKPTAGNSSPGGADDPQNIQPEIPDADQAQARNQAVPEVLSYLKGVNPNLALAAIYSQTGGSNWTLNAGWLGDETPCTWQGITCQGSEIVEIHLPNNNLAGGLPPEIGDLTSLLALDLSHNHLKGPIPEEIGLLVNLKHLNLEGNFELKGKIPPEIGKLQNLEDLILSSASAGGSLLNGELPTEIGDLIKLDKLIIEDTLIEGAIPPELGRLSKLTILSLSQNNLSGPIPDELFDLGKLRSLDLWANHNLGSSLSPKIGQLTHLDFLNISGNQFSGNLPAELGSLKNLEWIGLHDNPFEGALPASMIELNPHVLQFENTNLCEPADQLFQEWLDAIPGLSRTGIPCEEISTSQDDSTLIPSGIDPDPIFSQTDCLPGEILIYQVDFQTDNIPEWPEIQNLAQGWQIISDPFWPENRVVRHSGDQDATAILKSVDFKNAVWRTWVRKSGQGTAFLLWSWTDSANGSKVEFSSYQMEITYGGQNRSGNAIYRVEWPASHLTLGNQEIQVEDHTWVLYEVINYQDQMEIRVDHTPIFRHQDPNPLPAGKVGFEVWSTSDEDFEIYFDHLSLCGLTEPGIFLK